MKIPVKLLNSFEVIGNLKNLYSAMSKCISELLYFLSYGLEYFAKTSEMPNCNYSKSAIRLIQFMTLEFTLGIKNLNHA
jgi:hypothetical protein